jgi:hypothetical protein
MKNYKELIHYDRKFKLTFLGYGEWMDEPDEVNFEYKGFLCQIRRQIAKESVIFGEAYFGGYLTGYVYIPQTHPLYKKSCSEINCWGGITFSDQNQWQPEYWKIGFDCAHSQDLIPTSLKRESESKKYMFIYIPERYLFKKTYKNMSFCVKQCKLIAKQLYNLKKVQTCPENGV